MIGIVGAGLTGLALAHELAKGSRPFVAFEAAPRPGGVIRSGRVEGHLLEWGPQRARLTASLQALVEELGLMDELITAPPGLPLYVYRRGKLRRVPFSAAEFLLTDLLDPAAKARVLLEPLTGGPRPDETVADYFVRKLGRDAYEALLGPLYGGLYASDPADMLVGSSLGRVLSEFSVGRSLLLSLARRGGRISPPPACSFHEGLQTLTDALHAAHSEQVRLRETVETITGTAGSFRIRTSGGAVEVEQVVLTTPADATAHILAELAPEAARRIGRLAYNPIAVVHLIADTGLPALGYQVALSEDLYTRGVTFNESLFGRTGVYTAYLGGATAPEVVEWPDQDVGRVAAREFATATGSSARVLSVDRERMPAWDRSWRELEGLQLPAGLHLASNWESRPGIPGRLSQAASLAGRLAAR